MTPKKSYHIIFISLVMAMVLCFLCNISMGSVMIPLEDTLRCLFGGSASKESWQHIITNYRLPKAITAIIVGSGLGVSGLLMQTTFKNPLAGPFVLGISSGASLGIALLLLGSSFASGIVALFMTSHWGLIIAASLGSTLVLFATLAISIKIKDTMAILIIGLMFGSITTAIVSILSYFAPAEQLQRYIFWGFGSLGSLLWEELTIFGAIIFLGFLIAATTIKPLNILLLGEDYAHSLGINLRLHRSIIIIATAILSGSITAFAGPIAFIGLAIPHLTKQILPISDHKIIMPAVMLCGSILVLICDTIAQLPNSEHTLPINAVTCIIGAPVVIWLLVRKRKMLF